MADQTQRLEIATVKAEVGSNIVYRFANDAEAAQAIPTDSGDISNLKQVIAKIQEDGAEKISIATTIYPTAAAGLAATSDGGIFLVQSSQADEIYTVWKNQAGAAVNTGKTAMSSQAIQDALTASGEAAQAAEDAADVATNRTAGFLSPSAVPPVARDNGLPLELGDRYFNSAEQAEYLYKAEGWSANDSIAAIDDLENKVDPAKGAVGVGYDGVSVADVLDDNRPLQSYAALRAYKGRAKTIRITNAGISGRFRSIGAVSGYTDDGGTVIIATNGVVWLRINAEVLEVSWFGAVGDNVTDDTPAFQAAANVLRLSGGGKIRFHARHLLDSKLDVQDWVTFEGDLSNPGELRYDGTSDYDGKRSLITVNPAVSVNLFSGATFGHCLVMRKGLNLPFANATEAAAGVAAFSGDAFTAKGSDPGIEHMLVLGFNRVFFSNGFERPRVSHVQADCNSGVDFRNVLDIAYVSKVHMWPFTTTHSSWTTGALNSRTGVGVNFQDVGDWSKITECFTYGYATGFRVDGCNFVNIENCGADGFGAASSTAIGCLVSGNSKMTTVDNFQAAAQGYGVVVDTPSGTAAVTKIIGGCWWDNDIKHIDVRSGRAIILGNSFWRAPIAVDVNAAAKATIDDNDFEDITVNTISSGSFDNLNIGELNRFTNCVNNFGPRYVTDSSIPKLMQQSNSSAGGISIQPRRSRGTTAAKTALATNDIVYNIDPYGHDGAAFIAGGGIRQIVRAVAAANNMSTAWLVSTRPAAGAAPVDRVVFDSDGSLKPAASGAQTLGAAGSLWASVWSSTGTIQTSDVRTKMDVADASLGLDFIQALRPVSYRWKEGKVDIVGQEVDEEGTPVGPVQVEVKPGTRTHWGLIAQEVKEVADKAGVDFAGWVLTDIDNPDSQQALRYDQFISPLIKAVQELAAKNQALENRLKVLEDKFLE